jgi:ParB-like chromosome segregation protein Spo0J
LAETLYPALRALFAAGDAMLRVQKVKVDDIYVPTARRKTLHPETVRHLAEDILENGMKTPIQVRNDGKRYVLVEGLHRLEAAKWLGETEIDAYLVQAKRH